MPKPIILPLHTNNATLALVGGKGANLAKLSQAGFPVPGGLLVTTEAYRNYVQANHLENLIQNRLTHLQPEDPTSLRSTSNQIRAWFTQGTIPPELVVIFKEAYASLGECPVAVRSSATAEDLPDMSFAGQQDTFLNVVGEEALLRAMVDCWSSLWTARAIGYRARNGISHQDVTLSVVIQEMVPAEASGVLFTANPLSGQRTETVIDATLGLGEALVSGQVDPDHYVVDTAKRLITSKTLGAKAIAIRGAADGGVISEETGDAGRQALPDEQILALAELGAQVTGIYQFPQDIEWAWAGGQLYLLQSRPITSLFPVPEGMGPEPLRVMFSFASVQGILEPITPLGQDTIRLIFAGGASLFGFDVDHKTQGVIKIAGERLWGEITTVLRHPIGQRIAPEVFSAIDPAALPALEALSDDPRLGAGKGRLRPSAFVRIARFAIPMFIRVLRNWRSPESQAEHIQRESDQEIAKLQVQSETPKGEQSSLDQSIALYRQIYAAFPYAVPHIVSGLVAGLVPFFMLTRFFHRLTGSGELVLEVTRGLPNNVTTEMDLALWETAQTIRADSGARQHMQNSTSEDLAEEYLSDQLPGAAQQAIASFMKRYGMRGLGEIDIGRPRWREEPDYIMGILRSYLQIEEPSLAPDAIFERAENQAEAAITELEATARGTFAGALKARIIRAAARRVRALAGLRESPKFHIVHMMGIIRQSLLLSGQALVDAGVIEYPDDLFYLYLDELEALESAEMRDWKALIAGRRASYRRELRRVQIPRLLLSDGRAFYEGLTALEEEQGILRGNPVSPGVVEGVVRVVLDPRHADLTPGEILVCPATDPAWTPLFLAASGLVMEVGGMMTHGAIVAREYGIPAVVGVHQATTRLETGQCIQVNGSTGEIVMKASQVNSGEEG
jgi:pyruvate,water dikinase